MSMTRKQKLWCWVLFALILFGVGFSLAEHADGADQQPIVGLHVVDASTSNPATGTCEFGSYGNALIVVETDGASNAVTVQSRVSADAPWVTESGLGSTTTSSAPYQFRAVGWFHSIKVSVANAGGDTIDVYCSLYD